MTRHEELMSCRQYILDALRAAMTKRRLDDDTWIERERQAVAASQWAKASYHRGVSVGDVERIEVRAVGHVDYASKLALYVAEYVLSSG